MKSLRKFVMKVIGPVTAVFLIIALILVIVAVVWFLLLAHASVIV